MQPEEDNAAPTSVAITIQLAVLAVAFVVGRFLERIKFQWMGEAGAALLLGLLVGLILKAAGVGDALAQAVAFKGGIFFYILLPTIMFDAGYSLDTRMFIRNVGSLCLYAFVGTTISCFVVGLMMWQFGKNGWCYPMPLLANLTFGALISATDPVTVLAVFQRLDAQPDLYMNVFGESVLNDAVGMVLFNVISSFLGGKVVTAGSVFTGIGMFVAIFVGSAAIGIVIGLLAAFLFRSRYFYSGPVAIKGVEPGTSGGAEHASGSNSTFEVGLAVVFAYGSYLTADAARCSGIVAVVVNGMVMNMYVRPNLSVEASHKIETLFKTLSGLFELFVFSYIGTTMFLQDEEFEIWGYTGLALLALAVSRAANILPLTAVVNLLRPVERRIGAAPQFMMWWSGLRGAMAFALSVEADEKYGTYGKVMKTCTFYIVFLTVLFNGGSTAYFLRRLKLRAQDTPALILHRSDSLQHMHGFGSADLEAEDAEGGSLSGDKRDGWPQGQQAHGKKTGGGKDEEGTSEEEEDCGDRLLDPPSASRGPRDDKSAANRDSRSPHWLPRESSGSAGVPSSRSASRLLAVPSALLERVRSMNDGRLVARFDEFDRKMSKVLIHPDARREAELTSHASFRAGLAAKQQDGKGADGSVHGTHAAPQTLTPLSPSFSLARKSAAPAAAEPVAGLSAPLPSSTSLTGARPVALSPRAASAIGGHASTDAGTVAAGLPVKGISAGGPVAGDAAWASEGSSRSVVTAAAQDVGANLSHSQQADVAAEAGGPDQLVSLGSIHIRPLTGGGMGSASGSATNFVSISKPGGVTSPTALPPLLPHPALQ